jgi:metal-sulfur cluster biosynthetic enzyme
MTTAARVADALRTVIDPELGLNLVDLGIIYGIDVEGGCARILLTMTSPACPLIEYLKESIDSAVRASVPELRDVDVSVVWEPPWSDDMMSADARRELGSDG